MPPRPRDIPHGDNEEEEEDRYSHSNNVKSNVKSNNNHDDTTSLSKPLLHKQHHHHHHHYDNHRDPFSTNTSHFTQCSSWLAHFLNLTKQIVGAGALGLPGALATIQQQAGNTATIYALLPLALLIIAIGSVSAYGFCLIGRLCAVTQAMSYRQAWARTVDPRNSWMPAWACVLVAVSSVTTYNMVLAETLPALTRPFFELPRSTALLTVTTFCLLPLCLLKELSSLAPYSGIGLAAMFYTAVVMTQRYWYGHYQEGEHQPLWEALSDEQRPMFGGNDDDVNAMNDWKTVLSTFLTHPQSYVTIISMLSTSFMAHYNAPKYYWELPPAPNNSNSNNNDKSNQHNYNSPLHRYDSIVAASFFGSMLLMSTIAFVGYATFGAHSQPLILNNYAATDALIAWSKAAVVLSIISSYPLSFVGIKDGLFDLFQITPRQRRDMGEVVTVVLLMVLAAAALLIKDIRVMMALSGATWGNCVIYIFPSYMVLRGVQHYPALQPHVVPALLTGLLGAVLGAVGALQALINLWAFLGTFSFGMID